MPNETVAQSAGRNALLEFYKEAESSYHDVFREMGKDTYIETLHNAEAFLESGLLAKLRDKNTVRDFTTTLEALQQDFKTIFGSGQALDEKTWSADATANQRKLDHELGKLNNEIHKVFMSCAEECRREMPIKTDFKSIEECQEFIQGRKRSVELLELSTKVHEILADKNPNEKDSSVRHIKICNAAIQDQKTRIAAAQCRLKELEYGLSRLSTWDN
jgi:hypothetical protein